MGTLGILRALIVDLPDPPYRPLRSRLYHMSKNQKPELAPDLLPCGLEIPLVVGTGLFGLILCSLIFSIQPPDLLLNCVCGGLAASGALITAGGVAINADRIGRIVSKERTANTWEQLLLLPYERRYVMLHSVGYAFSPLIPGIGFGITLLIATLFLLSAEPSLLQIPALYGLLLIEWMQLMALGAVAGLLAACRARQEYSVLTGFVLGMSILVGRGVGGVLAVMLAGQPEAISGAGLLIGPVVGVAASHSWSIGWLIPILYLAGLEMLIRRLFRWCVVHAGEY